MNSDVNTELKEAIEALEKEKGIEKTQLLEAIRISLENAYKNYMMRKANREGNTYFASVISKSVDYIKVVVDENSYDYEIYLAKEVIEDDLEIVVPEMEIHLSDAKKIDENCVEGDKIYVEAQQINNMGHISIQNSKGLIIQKLREQEKSSLYNEFKSKEGTVVAGVVARKTKKIININLGRCDGILNEVDMIKNEKLETGEKIKVYIKSVEESTRGPKIQVSRSDAQLVKKLFEQEVLELQDGIVEIKSIAREAGSRTKIAVYSNDANVDAVGSCLGVNSIRVNSVVEDLKGEKIDIVNWDADTSNYVENALSPAKSIIIVADEENKAALVVVPDTQLSLAIGKDGQNVRLAAKLTGYKIDIKSETQAVEQGIYDKLGLEYDKNKFKKEDKINEEKPIEQANEEVEEVDDSKIENVEE